MFKKRALILPVIILLFLTLTAGCSVQLKNDSDTEETTSVSYDIDIGFTVLKFPTVWKDSVRVSHEFEGTIGTVEFFGTAGSHPEQHLFTLCFNQDGEIPIGTLNYNGQNVIICAEMNELEFDENWSREETDTLCAMQESVNFIVEYLEQNPDFTAD